MVQRTQLLIATLMLTAFQPVFAQGMQAGSMQSMTPSSAIGPEQDSLLPPEVVPIDPSSVTPAQTRQASMPAGQTNPMELRKQALGQLLGDQTSVPPAAAKSWRYGQTAQSAQAANNVPQTAGAIPGLMPTGLGAAPKDQLGAPNYQMANNQTASGQAYNAQTQTLTGGSQNQPQQINTRRGGFTNRFSSAATMGLGAIANPFMSGFMMAAPFARF